VQRTSYDLTTWNVFDTQAHQIATEVTNRDIEASASVTTKQQEISSASFPKETS
jgi:hypothetical protein